MILRLPLRGWEPNEERTLLLLVKFRVTALTASGPVFVDCHKDAGAAFGTDGLGSFDFVAVYFVCITLFD